MDTFNLWMVERGPLVSEAIGAQSAAICQRVSGRLADNFPNLCYDSMRFDAVAFQKLTFRETPRRLNRLIQVALLCNSLQVVEREYRWGWQVLSRFNVERRHMVAHARWYFEEVFASVSLSGDDKLQMVELRDHVVHLIEAATIAMPPLSAPPARPHGNGAANGNGNGHALRR